jgi:NDP-sugar pyrophosphorylase family protein
MLPILGKPIVERILDDFVRCGINSCILVVNPDDPELHAFAEAYTKLNLKVVQQPQPRGTADALRAARPYVSTDFILSACDQWIPVPELKAMLRRWRDSQKIHGLLATIEVPAEIVEQVGIVQVEGGYITHIEEKPRLEDAPTRLASLPLYCFRHGMLDRLDSLTPSVRGELELQQAVQEMIRAGRWIKPYPITRRLTLRRPVDLLKMNAFFLNQMERAAQLPVAVRRTQGLRVAAPVFIDENVEIRAGCSLGPTVYIERGARIGRGAMLSRTLVLRGSLIEPHRRMSNCIVYAEDSTNVLEFGDA